jgi:hypothetical protein
MPRRILDRIREAVRNAAFDMTVHAVEEMAEDHLDLWDVEASMLNGKVAKRERGEPRGTRYTVHGPGADGVTPVGTVGRFTETGRYLVITVYTLTQGEK